MAHPAELQIYELILPDHQQNSRISLTSCQVSGSHEITNKMHNSDYDYIVYMPKCQKIQTLMSNRDWCLTALTPTSVGNR